MNDRKILIVSASFYPQNSPRSFRTTELAKEFSRQGHKVTVLTPETSTLQIQFARKHNIVIKDLGRRKWKSVALKGKRFSLLLKRFFLRFSKLLFEYPNIELFWMVKGSLKNEKGYDILISIAIPYPVHWGVAASRSVDHPIAKIWIADCGDPYVGQENDSFKPPYYFNWVEKWFMKKADFISVPTNGAIQAYFPEFHHKIKVIPQGFRFEDYRFDEEKPNNNKPIFAYAGMFIPGKRDPSEFISFLKQQDIDYIFHIYTKTPQFVSGIDDKFKRKIVLHDSIPREDLLQILTGMDFLVNFENIGSKQTPSKLIDYLILRKPVLSIKTNCLDKKVVKEFLSGNYSGRMLIDNPDQYHIKNVCHKFLMLAV